jgi:hypothetical protein
MTRFAKRKLRGLRRLYHHSTVLKVARAVLLLEIGPFVMQIIGPITCALLSVCGVSLYMLYLWAMRRTPAEESQRNFGRLLGGCALLIVCAYLKRR